MMALSHDLPTRIVSAALATALNLAVGLALLMAPDAGMPGHGRTGRDGGAMFVVDLLPLERTRPADSNPAGRAQPSMEGADRRRPPAQTPIGSGERPAMVRLSSAVELRGGASSAPGEVSAAPASGMSDADMVAYRALLEAHLARFRTYPPGALRAGRQGLVSLHFLMDRNGKVLDSWIEESSGVGDIDREVLASVARAQPLPPPPANWPERIDISLPISFKIG